MCVNYHNSLVQILESERGLKVLNILELFSQQPSIKKIPIKIVFNSFLLKTNLTHISSFLSF